MTSLELLTTAFQYKKKAQTPAHDAWRVAADDGRMI